MSDKTEQLIEIVKQCTVLYDTNEHHYRNNRAKNRLWGVIAETIQEKDGDTVKTKWKNLRDSYSKHLRAMNSPGKAAKHIERYKAWPWVKQMSFLQPYLELPATQSNVTVKPKKLKKSLKKKLDKASHKSDVIAQQEASGQSQETCALEYRPSSHHNHRHTQLDKLIDYLKKRSKTEYDETDLIFLGYSKTIKKMSMRRQASIKFSIAKIIMEAEIEHAEETNNNVINRDSKPFNIPTEKKDPSEEYYGSLSQSLMNTTRGLSDPTVTDGPIEGQQYCYISTKAEPLAMDTTDQ